MGTIASPNVLLTLTSMADGLPDSGLTVEIVLLGDSYPGDAIALTEIGVTGKYKKETADGVAAVGEGLYQVYADTSFRGWFQHVGQALWAHIINVSDPHGVGAVQVGITDSGGYYTATDVEAALQEIGLALTAKADTGTALLLDATNQSVNESKPMVTNLNANYVNGAAANSLAGGLVILDALARVPLANLPDILTGKSADQVDGHDVGSGAGDIPELVAGSGAGKLSTTLLNKEVGGGNGNLVQIGIPVGSSSMDITLLNVLVGGLAGNIPKLWGSRASGLLSTTFLNRENPLTAKEINDNGSTTPKANMVMQSGWASDIGDGSDDIEYAIVFPSVFTSFPMITFSFIGVKDGAVVPSDPSEFDVYLGASHNIESKDIALSGVTIQFTRTDGGSLSNVKQYGIMWHAVGETSVGL